MDDQETVTVVALIASLWPNAPAYEDHHATAFHLMLREYPLELVQEALKSLADDGERFAPGPADLRARVRAIASPTPDWGQAWDEAITWARDHGYPTPPTRESFSHPAIYAAVQRFGYEDLCLSQRDQVGTTRAQFRQMYEGAVADEKLSPARERFAAVSAGAVAELAATLTTEERPDVNA